MNSSQGYMQLFVLLFLFLIVYFIVKYISSKSVKIAQQFFDNKGNIVQFKSKSDFLFYSELCSSYLKELINDYQGLPLEKFKEILYLLHLRENFKIERLSIIVEIMKHYGLCRSSDFLSTKEEVTKYVITDIPKTSNMNDLKSTNNITNLKMFHAGSLISVAGKFLFISQMLLLSIILINFIMFSNRQEFLEYLSPDNISSLMIFNGIILLISIILQLKGYSSLYNAGQIFKDND